MNKEPQRSNVTGLASLLAPASGASALWRDDDLGALLRHQLGTTVPGDSATFDQVLTAGRGDVESLNRVKEFAKSARVDADSGIPPAVCHVLYYAAIAAARTLHGATLTRLDDATLARGFDWAISLPWIGEPLRGLIRRAAESIAR